MNQNTIRDRVRTAYGEIASEGGSCCAPGGCGCGPADMSERMGYAPEDLREAPEGADLGLGCGNPHLAAEIEHGETVLDLGSGPGLDCFLAARAVGESGRVIGVDMTPAMLTRARENARDNPYGERIEFRLGEIEHLPVEDASVDVIISNCVVNLSPDKAAVFREAFRVLRPGGRLAISDIVLTGELPEDVKHDPGMLTGCVSGAESPAVIEDILKEAGFEDVRLTPIGSSTELIQDWFDRQPENGLPIISAILRGRKPA